MEYKGYRIYASATPNVTVYLNSDGGVSDFDGDINFSGCNFIYEADNDETGDYICDFESIDDIKEAIDKK
jgi:hypothetical protein